VSSATVEFCDRFTTTDMGRKVGGCCAIFLGRGKRTHLSNAAWAEFYLRVGQNRHAPKIGGCGPFSGGQGPHLTQCGLGRDLLPYQVES